ncbi:hypothetical protein [Brenneria salicis]|nr:hypothetical protein [Brenneria salicis]
MTPKSSSKSLIVCEMAEGVRPRRAAAAVMLPASAIVTKTWTAYISINLLADIIRLTMCCCLRYKRWMLIDAPGLAIILSHIGWQTR